MAQHPIDLALRHLSETKHLLESLIQSSENFDYQRARRSLDDIQLKIRDLGKAKSRLESEVSRGQTSPNICAVNFSRTAPEGPLAAE
jgi:hypothetical protein